MGGRFRKGAKVSAPFLSGRKLFPTSHLDAKHFSSSLYVTGAFLAATLMLELEGVSLNKFMCGFFKGNCLGLQKFLPLTQSLLVYAARSYGGLSSLHWKPGLGALCRAGTPCS